MKRFIALALLCLLLCGCTAEQPQETTLPQEPTETTGIQETVGLYDPDSAIEAQTAGAIRAYPLEMEEVWQLAAMGQDLLVISGYESTTFTKLSGENLYVAASVTVDVPLFPEASAQVTDKGVSYFDENTYEMVFLDTTLKETNRFTVPQDLIGSPVMSANRQTMYYCTADSVRALDMENGISRLLREVAYQDQTAIGLLLEDTVLQCRLSDGEEWKYLFISTQNGEVLGEVQRNMALSSGADTYYAVLLSENGTVLVYGMPDQPQLQLRHEQIVARGWFLETVHSAVTVTENPETGETQIDYFDLESGLKTASVALNGFLAGNAEVRAGEDGIYLLCYENEPDAVSILRWDTAATASADETVYTGPRYTLETPDQEGLAHCQGYAEQLGSKYGVEIRISAEAVQHQPWDYTLEAEFQVPLIRRELEKLEQWLASYPEGFLRTAGESSADGVVKICLVRSITGTPEAGLPASEHGIQFWSGENAYVALAVGYAEDQTLYHNLFHILETKVLSNTNIYYEWENLNPEGFDYDYGYGLWQTREESEYLQAETRAFINSYAMTFPTEDRATIMAYAMKEGNADYFQTEVMQAKLLRLCRGIRKAFGLEKSPETFIWEQYLNQSLAYGK